MSKFDHDLTDGELREWLEKFRNEGKYDYDFVKEALLAQLILELRKYPTAPIFKQIFG